MRRFFGSKILGFVPGWLALILVLGGVAAAAPPVFNGIVMMDASATTPSSSGFIGPVVVAQPTAVPTLQPGNPYTNSVIVGDGINNGLWELCNNCAVGIGAGSYKFGHYHMLWVTNPGDSTAPADLALGGNALGSGDNSTTGQNVGLGVGTLENKTAPGVAITGNSNVAVGNIALGYLTSGSGNNGIGAGAGECISTGSSNEIIGDGWSSLAGGCTGSGNVFIGNNAGFQASATMANAVFLGNGAGQTNSQGGAPVAIGFQAGQNLTGTNGDSVTIGDGAGKGAVGADGSRSVIIGASAGPSISSATYNVLIGFQSGLVDNTGGQNTFLGVAAGSANTGGSNNTAAGYLACGNVTTATWDTCLGYEAYTPSATTNGQLSIQNAIYGSANTGTQTTVSTGCLAFYQTTCTNGTVASAVPIIAPNGSATSCTGGHQFANGIMVISGAGAPTCTAPAASLYLRSDGASGSHMYVSQGSGTWTAVSGV